MGKEWIDAVMRLNETIVAAEDCFNAQVVTLVEAADRSQDTDEAEALLQKHQRSLVLLRATQTQLLQHREDEA